MKQNNPLIRLLLTSGLAQAVWWTKYNMAMKFLEVDIIEYENEYFPGWVRCSFADTFGKLWYIYEKAPVVSSDNITEETKLPIKGYVAGEIISQSGNIVYFCTEKPWYIETEEGENKFYVYEEQLIDEEMPSRFYVIGNQRTAKCEREIL